MLISSSGEDGKVTKLLKWLQYSRAHTAANTCSQQCCQHLLLARQSKNTLAVNIRDGGVANSVGNTCSEHCQWDYTHTVCLKDG